MNDKYSAIKVKIEDDKYVAEIPTRIAAIYGIDLKETKKLEIPLNEGASEVGITLAEFLGVGIGIDEPIEYVGIKDNQIKEVENALNRCRCQPTV
jgi:ribosomal protein S13